MEKLGEFTARVAIITGDIALLAYHGWVLSILWLWFITPFGVDRIGVIQAAGLYLIVKCITCRPPKEIKKCPLRESIKQSGLWILSSTFALAIGWIYNLWM